MHDHLQISFWTWLSLPLFTYRWFFLCLPADIGTYRPLNIFFLSISFPKFCSKFIPTYKDVSSPPHWFFHYQSQGFHGCHTSSSKEITSVMKNEWMKVIFSDFDVYVLACRSCSEAIPAHQGQAKYHNVCRSPGFREDYNLHKTSISLSQEKLEILPRMCWHIQSWRLWPGQAELY